MAFSTQQRVKPKETVEAFLGKIPRRLMLTVKAVCCDLYEDYINAARAALGNGIPVVADRFHVRKLYGKGLASFRKAELKRLKRKLAPAQYKGFKPAIALLRHQKNCFTPDEKRIAGPLFKLAVKQRAIFASFYGYQQIGNAYRERIYAEVNCDWVKK